MKISAQLKKQAGQIDAEKTLRIAQKWQLALKSLLVFDRSLDEVIHGLNSLEGTLGGLDVEGKQIEFKDLINTAIKDLPLRQTQVKEMITALQRYSKFVPALEGLAPAFKKEVNLFDALL